MTMRGSYLLSAFFLPFLLLGFLASPLTSQRETERVKWDLTEDECLIYTSSGGSVKVRNRSKKLRKRFLIYGDHTKDGQLLESWVHNREDVLLYLAGFLPPRPIQEGQLYEYKYTFQNNLLLPQIIHVRGRWIKNVKRNRRTFMKIRQKITLKSPRKSKRQQKGNWLFGVKGRVKSTILYDPERDRVQKLKYDGEVSFQKGAGSPPFREGFPLTVTENATYVFDAKREKSDIYSNTKPVTPAISLAVDYLKNRQNKDGSWGGNTEIAFSAAGFTPKLIKTGETALTLLALLASGVKSDASCIEDGFEYLRDQELRWTYTISLVLMAIEYKYISADERKRMTEYLKGKRASFKAGKRNLKPKDKKWMKKLAGRLKKSARDGSWRYLLDSADYDNSNSQFAVLGLHAARRCGINVPGHVWKKILHHWMGDQAEDGPEVKMKRIVYGGKEDQIVDEITAESRGWAYFRATVKNQNSEALHRPYLSMTAAGISSTQIAYHHLKKTDRKIEKKFKNRVEDAIMCGLAWLKKHYALSRRAGKLYGWKTVLIGRHGMLYALYGLERAMMLTRTRRIGNQMWYHDGVKILLNLQRTNGAWSGAYPDHLFDKQDSILNTSLALLFLKKPTLPVPGEQEEDEEEEGPETK